MSLTDFIAHKHKKVSPVEAEVPREKGATLTDYYSAATHMEYSGTYQGRRRNVY